MVPESSSSAIVLGLSRAGEASRTHEQNGLSLVYECRNSLWQCVTDKLDHQRDAAAITGCEIHTQEETLE
jgi:hypothetical protein